MNTSEPHLPNRKDEFAPVPLSVDQNLIYRLHFPRQEVLRVQQEKVQRTSVISKILTHLSNGIIKATIFFEDIAGAKRVDTTIEAVSEKEVVIAGHISIPIHRITQINLRDQ